MHRVKKNFNAKTGIIYNIYIYDLIVTTMINAYYIMNGQRGREGSGNAKKRAKNGAKKAVQYN